MIDKETIRYIINFITNLSPTEQCAMPADRLIGYTNNEDEMRKYKIVIVPSGFFDIDNYGTKEFFPKLPLQEWHGIPILYGQPTEKILTWHDEHGEEQSTLVLHADLIASAFFLISRYEEIYKRHQRDSYGRFPGKTSLPYLAGFIHRPIVDEYGVVLRQLLTQQGVVCAQQNSKPTFRKIYLTHHIFSPFTLNKTNDRIQHIRYFFLRLFRHWTKKAYKKLREYEMNNTRFLEWDRSVANAYPNDVVKTIFFMLTPGHDHDNQRIYHLTNYTLQFLKRAIKRYEVIVGFSCNRECSLNPEKIGKARRLLKLQFGKSIEFARCERLTAREPEDFISCYNEGIKHEFSMGYFDIPGFRLGTCRPVRFINPSIRQLTELVIHPLTITDRSLSDKEGLALNYEDSLALASQLIRTAATYNGELVLSWHSDMLNKENHEYHSRLYRDLLRLMIQIQEKNEESDHWASSNTATTEDRD